METTLDRIPSALSSLVYLHCETDLAPGGDENHLRISVL